MSKNKPFTPYLATGKLDRNIPPRKEKMAIPFCLIVRGAMPTSSRVSSKAELGFSTVWSSSNRRPEYISAR